MGYNHLNSCFYSTFEKQYAKQKSYFDCCIYENDKNYKGTKISEWGRQGETALQELRWRPGSV